MGVQEVQGNNGIPAYQKNKKAGRGEGFQESFLQNLKNRDQEKSAAADTEPRARTEEQSGVGRIGMTSGIRVNAVMLTEALQTAEVRHMSYEESDHIRIAVTEGYTLKGKIQDENAQVYVEAKYEDGRLEAYQVDMAKVSGETEHMIERFALETMEEA
ncbi:MAG: hypothetical protein K2N37_09685 [Lachnospiraceae bacterium]|nr:hypothetical protein [Lachnospiraceae bacterium]